jgi:hypothetical protein
MGAGGPLGGSRAVDGGGVIPNTRIFIVEPKESKIFYTSASSVYDGFGTEELSADAGRDDRGIPIRKVAILCEHLDWQQSRYASGLHGCVAPEEAERFRSIWTIRE